MSLHRLAARRDANEGPIVTALRAIGCDVRPASSKRLPDLVVGFKGQTLLVGVKAPDGPRGGTSHGRHRQSGDQRPDDWRGGPWAVVTTPQEAVAFVLTATRRTTPNIPYTPEG